MAGNTRGGRRATGRDRSDPVLRRAFTTVWLLLGVMVLGAVLVAAFAWVLTRLLA